MKKSRKFAEELKQRLEGTGKYEVEMESEPGYALFNILGMVPPNDTSGNKMSISMSHCSAKNLDEAAIQAIDNLLTNYSKNMLEKFKKSVKKLNKREAK